MNLFEYFTILALLSYIAGMITALAKRPRS